MAKKYINGYDAPRFILKNKATGEETIIDISFRYNALIEYYEKQSLMTKTLGGSKKKKPLHVDYEWRLSFVDYIEKDDKKKITQIENSERTHDIILIPHRDVPARRFYVLILDERRELNTHFSSNGDNTANYGIDIAFVNRDTILEVMDFDPDNLVTGGDVDTPFVGPLE